VTQNCHTHVIQCVSIRSSPVGRFYFVFCLFFSDIIVVIVKQMSKGVRIWMQSRRVANENDARFDGHERRGSSTGSQKVGRDIKILKYARARLFGHFRYDDSIIPWGSHYNFFFWLNSVDELSFDLASLEGRASCFTYGSLANMGKWE
jgi:hypothetical protein